MEQVVYLSRGLSLSAHDIHNALQEGAFAVVVFRDEIEPLSPKGSESILFVSKIPKTEAEFAEIQRAGSWVEILPCGLTRSATDIAEAIESNAMIVALLKEDTKWLEDISGENVLFVAKPPSPALLREIQAVERLEQWLEECGNNDVKILDCGRLDERLGEVFRARTSLGTFIVWGDGTISEPAARYPSDN